MLALGFGCNETSEREKIKNIALSAAMRGEKIDDALKEWNVKANEYDKLPRDKVPERYTRVYVYGGAFHFSHINRRHPFSPDGWAMLQITEPYDDEEYKRYLAQEEVK